MSTTQLEVTEVLAGGTGSSLAVSPDGETTVVAGPAVATCWRGDERVGTIDAPGYAGGPVVFSTAGDQVHLGALTVSLAAWPAGPAPLPFGIDLLTAGIPKQHRGPARAYARRAAAASPAGDRYLCSFVWTPSRGLGDDFAKSGPPGQVVLVDAGSSPGAHPLIDLESRHDEPVLALHDDIAVAAVDWIAAWDTTTGRLIGRDDSEPADRTDVRISPDGSTVAASRDDGTAELRSTGAFDRPTIWTAHPSHASAVAFHPTAQLLATASDDQQVKLWSLDAPGDEPVLVGWFHAEEPVTALAFHPQGDHLLVAVSRGILVVELDATS